MKEPDSFIEILRPHKRRADIASLVSIILVTGLLYATGIIADTFGVNDALRIEMHVGMIGIVIVVCIWQAAAFMTASIESFLRTWLDRDHH